MHIIELRVENFKRLTAVSIRPDGLIVEVTGKNGSGKSSTLDAIWSALGGAEVAPEVPVHEGADTATITLDLGEMKVVRKFRSKEEGGYTTSLLIENADGTRPKSPQTLLNDLVGRFSLDPMEFARMKPKEQFDSLKALVPGLDLDQIDADNAADFEKRTGHNRKAKELRAAAAAIQAPDKNVSRVDEAPILADLARAGEHNKEISDRQGRRADAERRAADAEKWVAEAAATVESLARQIADLEAKAKERAHEAATLRQKLQEAPPLPEPLDTAQLSEALSSARAANATAEKQDQRRNLEADAAHHEKAATALTEAMAAREAHKAAAIAAAKFPVEGLSLGKGEVLIDGFPFSQAASSKKIRTSVSLAMAMNPKIRVIRIMDGSLLDSDAMAAVSEMAGANDYQVWIETVSDGHAGAVLIEDGHVKEE